MRYDKDKHPKFVKRGDFIIDGIIEYAIFNPVVISVIVVGILAVLSGLLLSIVVNDSFFICVGGGIIGFGLSVLLGNTKFGNKLTVEEKYKTPNKSIPTYSWDYDEYKETYFQQQYRLTFNIERNVE